MEDKEGLAFTLKDKEGRFLVQLAREAVTKYVYEGIKMKPPVGTPAVLRTKCGVFVTLNRVSEGSTSLRGCIGYPEPVAPLVEATIDSAISAAVSDPRFPPVRPEELSQITVEVSVLTPMQLIKTGSPRDYPKKVKVGEDGLMIERGWNKGLLLPQVPVEWNWDVEEFLANSCMKAGLPPDAWLDPETKIYKFQAIIFHEVSPSGSVKREKSHRVN